MSRNNKIFLDQINEFDLKGSDLFRCSADPSHLVENPLLCNDCQQSVCESCYSTRFTCPFCARTINGLKSDYPLFLQDFLKNILLKCENWGKGCPEVVKYENYRTHTDSCKFKFLPKNSGCPSLINVEETKEKEKIKVEESRILAEGNKILLENLENPKKLTSLFREENQSQNEINEFSFGETEKNQAFPKNIKEMSCFIKREEPNPANIQKTNSKQHLNYFNDPNFDEKKDTLPLKPQKPKEDSEFSAKNLINYMKSDSKTKISDLSENNNFLNQKNKNNDDKNQKKPEKPILENFLPKKPEKPILENSNNFLLKEKEQQTLSQIKSAIVTEIISSENKEHLIQNLKKILSELENNKLNIKIEGVSLERKGSSESFDFILNSLPDTKLLGFKNEDFLKLTVNNLKALLEKRQMTVSGNKDDLILKLRLYLDGKRSEEKEKNEKKAEKFPGVEKKIKKKHDVTNENKKFSHLRWILNKKATKKDLADRMMEESKKGH